MQTIDAAANPAQAQQMINEVMAIANSAPDPSQTEPEVFEATPPPDTFATLPGGFMTFAGEVAYDFEVRELTGRDEEALARVTSTDRLLQETLLRGLKRVGTDPVSEELINNMLAGDRDYALLRIFMVTFGSTLDVRPYCGSCGDRVDAVLDLDKDIPVRRLDSPYDRNFLVQTSKGDVRVEIPTGHTQKQLIAAADKSSAELSTILLSNTVIEINDRPVIDKSQVLDLSIRDRRKISEEILSRNPGPLMQEAAVACPNCDTRLEVPLSLAGLFRL